MGKILVKGPDAARFLDMIYTNVMSNLKVGKCRYGLMCSENGFLSDDGVVARLSDDSLAYVKNLGEKSVKEIKKLLINEGLRSEA